MEPDNFAAETSEDSLLGGRLRLRQPARGYRVAIDPVLLAASSPARPGEAALELGIGSGAASLCLAFRVEGLKVMGLELQPELAGLARENAAANGLASRIEIHQGDLLDPPAPLARGFFHHVLANPPYHEAAAGDPSPEAGKSIAHREGPADLARWIEAARAMLRPKGSFALIHRADRLDDILAHLRQGFGDIRVIPLWPKAGRAAKRVILVARKGVATPLTLAPGLVLHEEDGAYTEAAQAILRDGGALQP